MKTGIIRYLIVFSLLSAVFLNGCKKDNLAITQKIIPEATVVNKFVWQGLHDYYLWNHQISGLTDAKYNNADKLNQMLNQYSDPQKLFKSLLYYPDSIDKWSFLVDSASIIDNWITGTSKTTGIDFMLYYEDQNTNNVAGFVRYVYKNSPAEAAGVKRGDIFIKINGQQITDANYISLLNSEIYKLGLATYNNGQYISSGETPTMTAIVMQENPVLLDTTFTYNSQKIGYLVYNGFNADFDLEVNDVFQKFKGDHIDQLVVDLRYNGGGSVQSAIYMGSMIEGIDQNKIFSKSQYNTEFQNYLVSTNGTDFLNDYFTPTISATDSTSAAAINTLNMNKVYFIVSDNTASASELLINALKPYMDVVVVGINTVGKYVGSMTVKDWDKNGKVNPADPYAMQPIIVKFSNSAGVTDFVNGLTPDINAKESRFNLLPFGNPGETLLSYVLADISGTQIVSQTTKSAQIETRKLTDSNNLRPYGTDMYISLKNKDFLNFK